MSELFLTHFSIPFLPCFSKVLRQTESGLLVFGNTVVGVRESTDPSMSTGVLGCPQEMAVSVTLRIALGLGT